MTHFRTFRNDDPPGLLRVWNEAFTGRSTVPLRSAALLEVFLLGKPYFDPAGLVVAEEQGDVIGWALCGFGPDAAGAGLDPSTGVVCVLGVLPDRRRQGLGSELLRRCEGYLRGRGARVLLAGPMAPRNPFTFGVYGGSQSPGFLASEPGTGLLLTRLGYRPAETMLVLQRHLDRPFNVIDGRFPALRKRFEVRPLPRHGTAGWYREAALGPIEVEGFRLEERSTGRAVGHAQVWEMDPYSQRWNEQAVGVLRCEVEEGHRRQGLARLLLGNVLRHYHDQYFTLVEAQVRQEDAAALALLRGLGFQQVDAGHAYRRDQ